MQLYFTYNSSQYSEPSGSYHRVEKYLLEKFNGTPYIRFNIVTPYVRSNFVFKTSACGRFGFIIWFEFVLIIIVLIKLKNCININILKLFQRSKIKMKLFEDY